MLYLDSMSYIIQFSNVMQKQLILNSTPYFVLVLLRKEQQKSVITLVRFSLSFSSAVIQLPEEHRPQCCSHALRQCRCCSSRWQRHRLYELTHISACDARSFRVQTSVYTHLGASCTNSLHQRKPLFGG